MDNLTSMSSLPWEFPVWGLAALVLRASGLSELTCSKNPGRGSWQAAKEQDTNYRGSLQGTQESEDS